ncbi:hypothetical protein QAD02_018197 [Eretmocerus hayati]|uniref:Uncharacterized protein n=1 Tax=Eretmocerus hayati TaxID=131215 RepID=A0ACC2PFP8_9HYME|nr:hypothetical protein QAD02_018197 [Eretmocerus hayati]
MARLTTLVFFFKLFGVVISADVFDLVDGIESLSAFIPGVGDLLSKTIHMTSTVIKYATKDDSAQEEGLDPQNSIRNGLEDLKRQVDTAQIAIPNEDQVNRDLVGVSKVINTIASYYDVYRYKYHLNNVDYSSGSTKQFVDSFYVTFDLKKELNEIEQTLIGNHLSNNLLMGLRRTESFEALMCLKHTSHQMRIIQVVHDILKAELQALELAKFRFLVADLTESCKEKPDHMVEFEYFLESFVKRTKRIHSSMKEAVRNAPREFWECDPVKPIEGETFIKLDPIFRRYIVSESDLKEYPRPRDESFLNEAINVAGSCDSYILAYMDDRVRYRKKNPCRGVARHCHDSNDSLKICVKEAGDEYKYEAVRTTKETIWGRKDAQCENYVDVNQQSVLLVVDDVCICECDEDERDEAVRYFSTLECSSDYSQNKVITGVRLIKGNEIFIHFEIQQAVMGKNADIDNGTAEWTRNCTNGKKPNLRSPLASDFYKVMWYNNKISFDDLSCPPKAVVTGLKFVDDEGYLKLQIRCTPFHFDSGKLSNTNGTIQFVPGKKSFYQIDRHLPTTRVNRDVIRNLEKYISFTISDEKEDVGSTLVPFIDIQRVSMENPTPLAGVSLVLRNDVGSAGYIALKITSLDFYPYFESDDDNYLSELVGHSEGDGDSEIETILPVIQSEPEIHPESNTSVESPSGFECALERNIFGVNTAKYPIFAGHSQSSSIQELSVITCQDDTMLDMEPSTQNTTGSFSQLSLDDMNNTPGRVNSESASGLTKSSEETAPNRNPDPDFRLGGRLHEKQGLRGRVQFLTERLISALDYSGVSHRQAMHILSAILEALGIDGKELVMNKSSFDEIRSKMSKEQAERIKAIFQDTTVFRAGIIHWDTKLIVDNSTYKAIDRMPFFQRFAIKTDFLKCDVESWDSNPDYLDGFDVVRNLRVVNDTAERAVKLTQEYINRTKDEELKQALLLTVPHYKRAFPDANKSTVVKKSKVDRP